MLVAVATFQSAHSHLPPPPRLVVALGRLVQRLLLGPRVRQEIPSDLGAHRRARGRARKEGLPLVLRKMLEHRFGSLSEEAIARIEAARRVQA